MAENRKKIQWEKTEKGNVDGKCTNSRGNKAGVLESGISLLADEASVDPTLSSLFNATPLPAKKPQKSQRTLAVQYSWEATGDGQDETNDTERNANDGILPTANISSVPVNPVVELEAGGDHDENVIRKRKRKRKGAEEELEDRYMHRLAREEEKEADAAARLRARKRQKLAADGRDTSNGAVVLESHDASDAEGEVAMEDGDEAQPDGLEVVLHDADISSPPPRHETQEAADVEMSKANRTVFLGNVSTSAIASKSARKALINHLRSYFPSLRPPEDGEARYKLESIRFRSTPYASAIPKKAAFARKELMDATAKSSNAYAVYSSPTLAREAARRLNATVVLGRHLRIDQVAHPAQVDHRRCVFVGNLGFVDDETNIQDANEAEGREKRKRGKEPADIEEGLWRTFDKCGTVESVRVIRDSTTRVGKGIAYVQFEDANAVEAALLLDGKKFPPMLPRKLRVHRAKAQKRNATPGFRRPSAKPKTGGYQRKVSGEEASHMGRTGKLLGRAAAAQAKQTRKPQNVVNDGQFTNGMKKPEEFVFEGHRASSKAGKSGLKLGKPAKARKGRPTSRSAKRGAAYKAGKNKAK